MSGPAVILLHPDDNVVVACRSIVAGEPVPLDGDEVIAGGSVTLGHKLARQPIGRGERIVKYGMPIGSAIAPIARGEWVHMHNMTSDYLAAHGRAASGTAA